MVCSLRLGLGSFIEALSLLGLGMWGARVECFVRVEGYRGDGLWGKGEGELGM
ncbi:hypothetical protein Tco_0057389, partial [Tanacetum coccineum]